MTDSSHPFADSPDSDPDPTDAEPDLSHGWSDWVDVTPAAEAEDKEPLEFEVPPELVEAVEALGQIEAVEPIRPNRADVGELAEMDERFESSEPMDAGDRFRKAARRAIEAIVMVAEEPMAPHLIGQLLEVSPVVVDGLCRELAEEYEAEGRGFELVRVAGGWRYQSHPDQAPYVERLVLDGQTSKLSAAALETLAIVAYKQPISRAQVASIRGVSVDGVMRTLQQRGYIAEVSKDPGPGQASMFGTTPAFLETLGINGLGELPPLGDFVPSATVVEQLERGLRPDRDTVKIEDLENLTTEPVEEGDGQVDEFDGFEQAVQDVPNLDDELFDDD